MFVPLYSYRILVHGSKYCSHRHFRVASSFSSCSLEASDPLLIPISTLITIKSHCNPSQHYFCKHFNLNSSLYKSQPNMLLEGYPEKHIFWTSHDETDFCALLYTEITKLCAETAQTTIFKPDMLLEDSRARIKSNR